MKLLEYALRYQKRVCLLTDNPCLGIKAHGFGKVAGKGHVKVLPNQDNDLSFLKSRVDEEAFMFYSKLMNQ